MVAKGRKAKFDYVKCTKLSLVDVENVRRLANEGRRGMDIANTYGVSQSLISMIVHIENGGEIVDGSSASDFP